MKVSNYKLSWNSERREAQRQRILGKKMPLSVRAKISQANKGQIPWTKGRKMPRSFGAAISKRLKGRDIWWMKGKTYEEIYGPLKAEELRRQRSASITGIKRSPATRAKLVAIRAKRIIPYKDTAPEKSVAAFLESRKLIFERHGLIPGCAHQFDILMRALKVAIEVDGCWWHGCLTCNKSISQLAREQRARDRWWEKKAKKAGWRVVRIWEHDVRAKTFAVLCEALGLVEPQKGVPCGQSSSIG